jgi:4-amino-4-deoxy-L-arabinose transferase-like glycosyltransferase
MQERKRLPAKKQRRIAAQRAEAVQAGRERAARVRTWRGWAFLAGVLVLAVVLRAANLTAQSLWADEGNSVRVTERPLKLVIDAARADVHPPGYYVLLWGWVKVFGQSEAAVRALSVTVGVALVGLVYLLGARIWGARAGWLAAFCAAVSPFQVQYSQEVRMYILVAFLGALAVYAFVRWIDAFAREGHPSLAWSGVYVVASAAGLWVHYMFPIVIAAVSVAWLVWWLGRGLGRERARIALWWAGMHAAILVLYLPWLPVAWHRITAYGPISEGYTLGFVVEQWLRALSVGETAPSDDLTRWIVLGCTVLAILGAWAGFSGSGEGATKRRRGAMTLCLVALTLAPAATMAALAATGRPAYRPKFYLVASPAFMLLIGGGIARLERSSGAQRGLASRLWLLLCIGLVAVGAIRSLRNYYLDPAYARSDYRAIAADIAAMAQEDDAVLLNAPNQWEVFTYYYRDGVPVYPLPRSRPPVEAELVTELASIAARHDRLYAVLWAEQESDPERIVERWLASNAYKASETWYGDVRLAVYGLPLAEETPALAHALDDVRFGEEIALRSYYIEPAQVQPGDVIRVALSWEALNTPSGRYKVFLHLVEPDGKIAAQVDTEPGDGMDLTTTWQPGRGVIRDRYGLLVPPGAPGGTYQILVGLYDVSGAPRLPLSVDGQPAGDALTLGSVTVG